MGTLRYFDFIAISFYLANRKGKRRWQRAARWLTLSTPVHVCIYMYILERVGKNKKKKKEK